MDKETASSCRAAAQSEFSSSDNEDVPPPPKQRRRQVKEERNDFDSSSSDSDSSVGFIRNRKHNNAALIEDSDSSSFESDWDSDAPPSTKTTTRANAAVEAIDDSSSESDGQSDKCPICLLKFKGQEIGSPDSCDHSFCYECILEWSKNVTTCPIDRQQFQLILVKKHLDGSIVRQTPVQSQQAKEAEAVVEDSTFCEVCGSSDREDRMLLCDGCDLGFHLECLNPPLEQVPTGTWLCPDCGPEDLQQDITIYVNEVEVLYHDAADMGAPANPRRVMQSNVVPRTRQSDRIRARIISNRRENRIAASVGIGDNIQVTVDQPSTSSRRTVTPSSGASSIRITYEEAGQEIVIETKSRTARKFKRRKKKRKNARRTGKGKKAFWQRKRLARAIAETKTTKRRLAKQIGICPPRRAGQILPDMRIPNNGRGNLTYLRGQAGIPSLSLFGNREELDYFSGSDADDDGDGGINDTGVMVRRRPNISDALAFRRSASRKALLLPQAPSTSSCDILGSIMDSQAKMHSKHTVLSLNKDGTLKIDTNKNLSSERNRNRINVNDTRNIRTRNAPMYSSDNSPGTATNESSQEVTGYRGNDSRLVASSSGTISNNSVSTSGCGDGIKSESELDIYSDIETVSTSKVEAEDSDKAEDSPEKSEEKIDEVVKTEEVDTAAKDAQEEDVSSTTNVMLHSDEPDRSIENTDDEECPNFSIYSKDTINLVANRNPEQDEVGSSLDVNNQTPVKDETSPQHAGGVKDQHEDDDTDLVQAEHTEEDNTDAPEEQEDDDVERQEESSPEKVEEPSPKKQTKKKKRDLDLYSDSDEEVVRTDASKPFGIGDIRSLTEDISEDERSYTPCLDERMPIREGLEGLDTEAISEDEKNDFDESQELKAVSDGGDALEINAKESELDFTKPEDYEEGEIVDKLKKIEEAKSTEAPSENHVKADEAKEDAGGGGTTTETTPAFKRISKSTKDRNYRDKERDRSRSYSKEKNKENEREKKRERKKEKRKELERYNVRNVVSDKPRKTPKDKFGRDARRKSTSRSSRSPSYSPAYRSASRGRGRSFSPRERPRNKRRARSRGRSTSRSRSRSRRRSLSRKRRSLSRSNNKRRSMRSLDRKTKKTRSVSRQRTRSATPRRNRDWEAAQQQQQQRSRAWSPSLSRSRSPERHMSPSWTPPRVLDTSNVKSHNLTVILTNDSSKKKKDKRKSDKKKKDGAVEKATKKRKRDKTPLPSKEVFASGDNILVSVSFNKETEEISKRTTKQRDDEVSTKRTRKEKEKRRDVTPPTAATQVQKSSKKKKQQQDLAGVKPVAIIDLDRSPFKELTPSPKDVIVLSDSDHSPEKAITCDSSQQALDYAMGPKTPPEPQVKFSLTSKLPQLRQITNPLHDPEDENEENEDIDPQDELEQRLNEAMHKGPNTPSDPPNSPPSSPDAYDPFDPTKSPSRSPDNNTQSATVQKPVVDLSEDNTDSQDKLIPLSKTPEVPKSHTPPLVLADIQPADSQSNANINTPDESSSLVSITDKSSSAQQVSTMPQGNSPIFPNKMKSVTPTIVYSSVTSTPTSSVVAAATATTPRISILNSTIITPVLAAPQQPRVPQANASKTSSSPLKASPTKASVKMMPGNSKRAPSASSKPAKNNRSTDSNDSNMDLDSPYSPGPSDFEDLFEPPTEHKTKAKQQPAATNKTPGKTQNTFDVLFGSPASKNKNSSSKNDKGQKRGNSYGGKCKQVKVDEDSLKILDDLPNSAVEMQVKDKFLKKLNRQERVVEEVKLVLKPHYNKKHINKEEYKDILRRAVPKICHNKSGEINPAKIQNLVEAYVKKFRHSKKVSSSSSVSLQK